MIQMSLEDAIESDDSSCLPCAFAPPQIGAFSEQNTIAAVRVQLLGHVISQDCVRLHDDKVAALPRIHMPADIKQLRSLLDGPSYYLKLLPKIARRIRPITTVLNAHKAKRRSWRATRHYARIIARPPAVGSPRPPLQRLLRRLRFARHRLRARPALAQQCHLVVMPRPAQCRTPPIPSWTTRARSAPCPADHCPG